MYVESEHLQERELLIEVLLWIGDVLVVRGRHVVAFVIACVASSLAGSNSVFEISPLGQSWIPSHMHAQMHAQMQEFHAVSEHNVLPPHTRSSDHQGM